MEYTTTFFAVYRQKKTLWLRGQGERYNSMLLRISWLTLKSLGVQKYKFPSQCQLLCPQG
jgi:hypothetical protein